jgi:predicted DNA-binding protein
MEEKENRKSEISFDNIDYGTMKEGKTICVRLPKDLHLLVSQIAKKNNRTKSSIIRTILSDYLTA